MSRPGRAREMGHMLQLQQGLTRAHGCKEQRSGVTTQNRRAQRARATNPRTGGRLTQRPAGSNPRTGQAAVIFFTLSAPTCSTWTLAVLYPRSYAAVVLSLRPTMTWPRFIVTVVLVRGLWSGLSRLGSDFTRLASGGTPGYPGICGQFEFVYVPADFWHCPGHGFAFVNFFTAVHDFVFVPPVFFLCGVHFYVFVIFLPDSRRALSSRTVPSQCATVLVGVGD